MDTLFGVPWDALGLDDLRAFLKNQPDEGLTWEAKGGDIRPEHVRNAVCAFANSDLGGFLVLGVSRPRATGIWAFDHWEPRGEPGLWVEDCLAHGGVAPRPRLQVKDWRLDDGVGRVAVLAVDPVAIPPALTAGGEVWTRVTAASVRVTDPADLRRLFDRGRDAERRAEAIADAGLTSVEVVDWLQRPTVYALSLAVPGLPADISATLFRHSLATAMEDALGGPLTAETLDPRFSKPQIRVDRSSLKGSTSSEFGSDGGFSLMLTREGAFVVARADAELAGQGAPLVGHSPQELSRLWEVLVAFARRVGALPGGPAFVAIWLSHRPHFVLRRWVSVAALSGDDLASIQREAKRASGEPAWEPEV